MGNHTNYYFLILSLIRLKDELHRVNATRLQPLIKLLSTKSIQLKDGCEKVPSNKNLAAELGISVTQCNSLLRLLIIKLWEDFELNKPLEIDNVIHNVIIMLHWEEWEQAKSNNSKDLTETLSINLVLKETPRIGEEIEFEVVPSGHYGRGIVQEIKHKIQGKTQIIEVYAHPWDTDYDRWMKLKEKYELHQRWLKQINNSY